VCHPCFTEVRDRADTAATLKKEDILDYWGKNAIGDTLGYVTMALDVAPSEADCERAFSVLKQYFPPQKSHTGISLATSQLHFNSAARFLNSESVPGTEDRLVTRTTLESVLRLGATVFAPQGAQPQQPQHAPAAAAAADRGVRRPAPQHIPPPPPAPPAPPVAHVLPSGRIRRAPEMYEAAAF
jgi:hypothetical protein